MVKSTPNNKIKKDALHAPIIQDVMPTKSAKMSLKWFLNWILKALQLLKPVMSKKVPWFLIIAGVAMIAQPWWGPWVVSFIKQAGYKVPDTSIDGWVLFAIGIVLHMINVGTDIYLRIKNLEPVDTRSTSQIAQEAAQKIAPILESIANAFEPSTTSRPSGYFSEELIKARKLAKSIQSNISQESILSQSSLLSSLCSTGPDAKGMKPYFHLSSTELRRLSNDINEALEQGDF